MAEYTTLSKQAIDYICALIRNSTKVSDAIDDINVASDSTYSSYKVTQKLAEAIQVSEDFASDLVSSLRKLEAVITTTQPTVLNTEPNVMYYFSSDGNSPYHVYLRLSDNLIDMGSTEVTLTPIVDNLISTSSEESLSANQGRILDSKKLDIDQGIENKGKTLIVDENGLLEVKNIIDDSSISDNTTYSSKKIDDELSMKFGGKGYFSGNIDELVTVGSYCCVDLSGGESPFANWFTCEVFEGGTGSITQFAQSSTAQIAIRHNNGVGWSGWQRLVTTNANVQALRIDNGSLTQTSIIPWADGTHYRTYEGNDDSDYTDIITNDGVARLVKVINGVAVANSEISIVDDPKYSNKNLLDNSFFQVNQRGSTSYNKSGYTVDRWYYACPDGKPLTKTTEGISLDYTGTTNNFIAQYLDYSFDELKGKGVTLSVMLPDGTIIKDTGVFPTVEPAVYTFVIRKNFGTVQLQLAYASAKKRYEVLIPKLSASEPGEIVKIKAIKLELGAVSTLANDLAPDYATELAKCQRYYQRIEAVDTNSFLGIARFVTSTDARLSFSLPVTMRVNNPTLSCGNISSFKMSAGNAGSTDIINPTSIVLGSKLMGTILTLRFITPTDTAGNIRNVYVDTGAYIDVSADL